MLFLSQNCRFLQALADHRFFAENDTVHTYIAKDQVRGHHCFMIKFIVVIMTFSFFLSLYLTVQVSNQDPLGGGSLWSHITKSVSDYQLNSVQAQVGVVFDQ